MRIRRTFRRWGQSLLVAIPLLIGAGQARAQDVPWSSIPWPAGADFTAAASPRACVRIDSGLEVVLDDPSQTDYYLDSLVVEGTLRFEAGANLLLNAHKVVVEGTFEVGTEAAPFVSNATVDLTDGTACATAYRVRRNGGGNVVVTQQAPNLAFFHPAGETNRTLLVRGAATLDLHGAPRASTWKTLARRANPRETFVRVPQGSDWRVGDRIVIASTDYDPSQAEVRTILQIQPAGPSSHDLVLDAPLAHLHWSGRVGSLDEPRVREDAEVGLLTHNVKVTSSDRAVVANDECQDLAYTGAEITLRRQDGASPVARVEHVEIYNAGKFGEDDRYPIYFDAVGPVPGSYLRGLAVHDSANRAIGLSGTQQLVLEDNVAHNVIGHAYYLERMEFELGDELFETVFNVLRRNLGVHVRACGLLDLNDKGDTNPNNDEITTSVFYFDDPRNGFLDNAAAGAAYAGFYYGNQRTMGLDEWHLCAEDAVDYAGPGFLPLDESFLDASLPYGSEEYTAKGYRDLDGSVHCHGTFVRNVGHSSLFGFWSEEHKDSLIRVVDFLAYKNSDRAFLLKNHGVSELFQLRAADNATALWPASHAYHVGYTPRFLLVDSHVIGETANTGEIDSADEAVALRSLPAGPADALGDGGVPIYGVEVYEGHLHVTDTYFELLAPLPALPDRPVAAFGRHQSFPFYTNNPDNSVGNVTFDAQSNRVWFDDPALYAEGEATVILHDRDGRLSGTTNARIVPKDDFIVPGQVAALQPAATFRADWNAHVVTDAEKYGQLLVEWCDTGSEQFCDDHRGPSSGWTSENTGVGVYGVIMGLEIRDETDCGVVGPGCPDVLEAEHSNDGTHDKLGGNVLSGHDYEVTFWRNENGSPLLTSSLASISALQVHYRYGPQASAVGVSVPLDVPPTQVFLYRGESNPTVVDITARWTGAPPVVSDKWYYDAVGRRVYLYLDAKSEGEDVSVLLLK